MFDNFCVFLDAGHGGLDSSGRYVTAPSKMFEHDRGSFHKGSFFYEGVWNRRLTGLVLNKLISLNINYIMLSHEYLDLSLQHRVDKANWYYRNYKRGILISNHANASASRRARGFEVYTTPGTTMSDVMAEIHWNNVEALLGGRITMRSDTSDGDHDKEARFYIIQKTLMPAMLVEHLFFDNFSDASLLMDDEIVELFAEAQVRTIIEYFNRES
jgi:N-acetylmuramoyl-L-alanine amidase